MRVLLDTNIIVHREASTVVKQQIGTLFRWLDRLQYTKCIHPLSIEEIRKHGDPNVVATFEIKLSSYSVLRTQAPQSAEVAALWALDVTENSRNDTLLLNEVFAGRVDILVTEDRGIHSKARTAVRYRSMALAALRALNKGTRLTHQILFWRHKLPRLPCD